MHLSFSVPYDACQIISDPLHFLRKQIVCLMLTDLLPLSTVPVRADRSQGWTFADIRSFEIHNHDFPSIVQYIPRLRILVEHTTLVNRRKCFGDLCEDTLVERIFDVIKRAPSVAKK